MKETVIRSNHRTPIFVVPRDGGGWLLTQGSSRVYLAPTEMDALVQHVRSHTPTIGTTTPAKARLERHVVV